LALPFCCIINCAATARAACSSYSVSRKPDILFGVLKTLLENE
jgi:hypothetical protein